MGEAVVVIGVGNNDRGDDAAGRWVAAALRGSLPGDVVVVESLPRTSTGKVDRGASKGLLDA